MSIHIGEKIKEVADKRGISKAELGRRLNMTASNVHKIFDRLSIDTGLLEKISNELQYNFFLHFIFPDDEINGAMSVMDEIAFYKRELLLAKEKAAMLEKINDLLEEKIANKNS